MRAAKKKASYAKQILSTDTLLHFFTYFFGRRHASDYMPLQFSCVSTKKVKKPKRVRSVSVGKIWVVRKEHFGVTACGSCYRLLHFSQLTHIVTVEVGWDPELPGTLFLTCFSKLFRTSSCKDFKCEYCKSWYFWECQKSECWNRDT